MVGGTEVLAMPIIPFDAMVVAKFQEKTATSHDVEFSYGSMLSTSIVYRLDVVIVFNPNI